MKDTAPNKEEAREFQNAVDHRLSGLKEDPFLARRIIAKEQEEKKVKKKMTLGFALALSLLLIVSAALAENWPTVTEFMSNAGTHPDLVTSEPMPDSSPLNAIIINRHAVERVYKPVDVKVVDENGEKNASFTINAQVAQAEYRYTLVFVPDGDGSDGSPVKYTLSAFPETPTVTAPAALPGESLPFAPYLFEGASVNSISYDADFSIYSPSCNLRFHGTYSLIYNAEITLNQQGQIISATPRKVSGSFTLEDKNGVLSDGCYFPEEAEAPAATPQPLLDQPEAESALTAESTPQPFIHEAEHMGRIGFYEDSSEEGDIQWFGSPITLHGVHPNGTEITILSPEEKNMSARFNREAFESSMDFDSESSLKQFREDYLTLSSCSDLMHASFELLEEPIMDVVFYPYNYVVEIYNARVRAEYTTDLYYSEEAYRERGNEIAYLDTSPEYLLGEDRDWQEFPIDFVFVIPYTD